METQKKSRENFCQKCGQPTITNCKNCSAKIRGYHHIKGVSDTPDYVPPSFCPECGNILPWTERKLLVAKNLADELKNISDDQRQTLKESLEDIVVDTPETEAAAIRVKRILNQIGKEAAKGILKSLKG